MSLNDTIANLILQKGRAQGAGVAGAGQAWGSALSQIGQNIGQTLTDIPMRAQQEKIGALQLDITKRRADKEKLIEDTQQAISGLMSDPSVLNDDGTFNIQSITQKLSQPPGGGEGPTQPFDVQTIYGTLDPINKVLTEARSNGLKYQQSKANALAGLAAGALRLGKQDGNYFSHASSALASAQKSGLMTPDETTKMLTHLVENQDQIPALLEDFVSKSTLPPIKLGKDDVLVNALAPETILAKGPTGPPTTAALAADAANPNSPTQSQSADALERLQAPASATQAETARHNAAMEDIGKMTAGREAARDAEIRRHNLETEKAANPLAAMQGQATPAGSTSPAAATGEDFLKTLPPQIASEVKAYAEGRRPFPAGFALKSPYFQSMIQMVGQYDPTFDAANYNARNKARTDFTSPSGTGGKTINALNTALQHAGKLSDLIESLDNTEYPLANAVVNPLKTAVGKTGVTNFKAVAPQLMKEIERAWRGTGGSTADIQELIQSIGSNLGKQQQREALNNFVELVKGKLDSTEQQRNNIMGPAADSIPILFKDNESVMSKITDRAAAKGKAAPAGPSVGEKRTYNGETRTWNGSEWVK